MHTCRYRHMHTFQIAPKYYVRTGETTKDYRIKIKYLTLKSFVIYV